MNARILSISAILSITVLLQPVNAQNNTKKTTPLMGWASWNQFGVNIDEMVIKGQADAMVSHGLAAVGFNYINIDDGFFNGRNDDGSLKLNSTKFPKGFGELVEYIHSKGLKAGYYSEAGINTCGSIYSGQPGGKGGGLYGHDQQDADLVFLKWNFDFIKVDYCGGREQKLDEKTRYTEIKQAIDNTGRKDIIYNVCRWQFPGTWITTIADSWRMSNDINFTPGSKAKWKSIISIVNQNKYLAPYASIGHYNDMDMLEVGRGMSFEEDKSHFTMWCILSSPLVLGHDMTKTSDETKKILTNKEVIAVNQDPFGIQAQLISEKDGQQVWVKHLNGPQSKEYAVALLNTKDTTAEASVKWEDLFIVGGATVRDLWANADMQGIQKDGYTVKLPAHGVSLIKVSAQKTKLKDIFEAEYAWLNNFNLTVNTAILSNQAKAIEDSKCSGGAKAVSIGNRPDNFLEVRDVFAKKKGKYTLKVFYFSQDKLDMTVTVNGKGQRFEGLSSGGKNVVAELSIPVKLNKGYNTVRIGNDSGFTPDIDKIEVNLNK